MHLSLPKLNGCQLFFENYNVFRVSTMADNSQFQCIISLLQLLNQGLVDLESINLYIGAPRSTTCCSQSDRTPKGFSLSHPSLSVSVQSSLCTTESLPLPYFRKCSFILTATASMSDCRKTWIVKNSQKTCEINSHSLVITSQCFSILAYQ